MFTGKELKNKIKQTVGEMSGNEKRFELDDMRFLVVKEGTEEAGVALKSKPSFVEPQTIENERYLIFSE